MAAIAVQQAAANSGERTDVIGWIIGALVLVILVVLLLRVL